VDAKTGVSRAQGALRGDDIDLASKFAFTFLFRPLLKVITFACAAVVLAVILGRFLSWAGGTRSR
jgi:hypothetical protein